MRFLPLLLLAAAACRAAPGPEPAAEHVVVWRQVGSWSGHGNAQTGSFSSDTGSLRVRWETSNEREPGTGSFTVTLHSAVSGRPLLPAVDHAGVGKDQVYLHEDPRVFYFEVVSANVDWSMTVEEGIAATIRAPRESDGAVPHGWPPDDRAPAASATQDR